MIRRLATIVTLSLGLILSVHATATAADDRLFTTEAEAIKTCGSDPVVWLNRNSGVYHTKESRWYGKTKDGAFGCRSEMDKAGHHVASPPAQFSAPGQATPH